MQHGDPVRDLLHEVHVVLDDDHRARLGQRQQELRGLLAFGDAHAGDRLVEEEQLGILDDQRADLEPLLLPWLRSAARSCKRSFR